MACLSRAAFVGLAAVVSAQPWGQPPSLVVVEPTPQSILAGPADFEARVTPAAARVERIVFYVDGDVACEVRVAPFRCRWDAGASLATRTVRVVATLQTGDRLVQTVRTRDVALSESVSVDSVLVTARVTDGRGRFISGLTAADFVVKEDGIPQKITLTKTEAAPAHVVLALDMSGSMADALPDVVKASLQFVRSLGPDDSVRIMAFNTTLFALSPWGRAAEVDASVMAGLRAWGGTAMFDAMVDAARQLQDRPGRRALVMFTDGEDQASRGSIEAARVAVQRNDVLLFVVATGAAADNRGWRERLTRLAEETGGAFLTGSVRDVSSHFASIVQQLGEQYLLAYEPIRPRGDGAWRAITVETRRGRYEIRARRGYFATAAGGGAP